MLIYCCADMMFSTKVRATAEAEGVASRPARDADMLQRRLDRVEDGRTNDAVTGVIVDLEIDAALDLIEQVRQHDEALPIVAFGSHVLADRLRAARAHGADAALPRSAFTAQLPDLVRSLAQPGAEVSRGAAEGRRRVDG